VTAQKEEGGQPSAPSIVWTWVAAAWAILLGVSTLSDRAAWPVVGLGTFLLFVLFVTIAERAQLHLAVGRASAAFTLIEVAVTAGLLLLPSDLVIVGTALGATLAQALQGLRLDQGLFNAAMATVGAAAATLVMSVTPSVGPLVEGRPVLGALLGMAVYALVNYFAIAGLLLRVAGAGSGRELRRQFPFAVATTVGTTTTGIVVAVLWVTEPWLTLFALVPAAAIHLAARGSQRTRELLEDVQTERDRLTLVVDGASDGILLLDSDGRVQLWNSAMEGLTGIPSAEAVGHPITDVLTAPARSVGGPGSGGWLITADGRHARAQAELATTMRHRDGSTREVRESHALLRDGPQEKPRGEVVVVRDVSRRAQLERLRTDFVARISHELRTPLTPIQGFARTLRTHGDRLEEARRQQLLDLLIDRTDHLARLIDDLLLVTRVDAEDVRGSPSLATIDLGDTVRQVLDGFRQSHPHRPVLYDADQVPALVRADLEHARRIVRALLDNADRYSDDPDPIRVQVSADDEWVVLAIDDQGPGIPTSERESVFEPFHRLEDPLTMRTSGVGLGLFLSRRLAMLMGGRLDIVTPHGTVGTRVELRLQRSTTA
jgi:PAS domain S-box-containing protein